jgi:hypothetical protein
MLSTFVLSTLVAIVAGSVWTDNLPTGPFAPVVIPKPPTPNWSWDTIPLSLHGAVKTRTFTAAEVAHLAKYHMYTAEKWYTPCGSKGPTQSGPECAIESKTEALYKQIKAINPKQTTILYWNSMFDFAFYTAHQHMLDLEASGVHAFLRDETGEIISLCNDGNVYCNITTFDITEPAVRKLWVDTVINATATGYVDGIFADHSTGNGVFIGNTEKNDQAPNQLCNGKGSGRMCYNFTQEFTASFNSWHTWATNYTQDVLSKTTGGPVIQGPFARMGQLNAKNESRRSINPCNFDDVRETYTNPVFNKYSNSSINIIEASLKNCIPTETCLAAYLTAVQPYTYLHCMYNKDKLIPDTSFPEMDYPLGEPESDAKETAPGSNVWTRKFKSGTHTSWDNNKKKGTVTWAKARQ